MASTTTSCVGMTQGVATTRVSRRPFGTPSCSKAPAVRRAVVASAQKDQREGADQKVLKISGAVLSAFAAAQLALLPGAVYAGEALDAITDSSARQSINERTSNLPSLGDVGRSIQNAIGSNTTDPKEIGNAIDRNTPDVGQALKDLPDKTSSAAKDAADKVNKNTPNAPNLGDLSAVPDPKKVGQDIKGKVTSDAKSAQNKVSSDLKGAKNNAPDLSKGLGKVQGKAEGLKDKVQGAAKELKGKAQKTVGDLSAIEADQLTPPEVSAPQIPSLRDIGKAAREQFGNSPNPGELTENVKSGAKDITQDIRNNTPDLGNAGPDLGQAANDAKDKIKGAANSVGDLSETIPDPRNLGPNEVDNDLLNTFPNISNKDKVAPDLQDVNDPKLTKSPEKVGEEISQRIEDAPGPGDLLEKVKSALGIGN